MRRLRTRNTDAQPNTAAIRESHRLPSSATVPFLPGARLDPAPCRRSVLERSARAEAAAAAPHRGETPPIPAAAPPLPEGHPQVQPQRIGVLLLNLGTPDATDYWSMRRYLKEFLSDERVIDLNPLLWKPLLQPGDSDHAAVPQRQGVRRDLEPGTGQIALAHHHARARCDQARRGARGARCRATTCWSTGRCATVSRRRPRCYAGWSRRAARGCCCSRSIRSTPRRRRRPPTTRRSGR